MLRFRKRRLRITRELSDADTGEILQTSNSKVKYKLKRGYRFMYPTDLAKLAELVCKEKKPSVWRVLFYLIERCDYSDNCYHGPISDIARDLKVSRTTAYDAVDFLKENDVLLDVTEDKKAHRKRLLINPEISYVGEGGQQRSLVIYYKQEKHKQEQERKRVSQ